MLSNKNNNNVLVLLMKMFLKILDLIHMILNSYFTIKVFCTISYLSKRAQFDAKFTTSSKISIIRVYTYNTVQSYTREKKSRYLEQFHFSLFLLWLQREQTFHLIPRNLVVEASRCQEIQNGNLLHPMIPF